MIYTAVPEVLGEFVTYLTEECCGGRPELCAALGIASASTHPGRSCCESAETEK